MLEAKERAAEIRLRARRLHQHPIEPLALADRRDGEALAHIDRTREQHGRCRRQGRIDRLHGDLLQVAVIEPQVRSVADHELPGTPGGGSGARARTRGVRGHRLRMDVPAEFTRTLHDERAGRAIDLPSVRIGQRLQECGAQRM